MTDALVTLRRINKSPSTVDEKEWLKKSLTTPPVKKIDLHFPLGLEVTARNMKGVTIKDALDAIYKQYRKKVGHSLQVFSARLLLALFPCLRSANRRIIRHHHGVAIMCRNHADRVASQADDELENPVLAGFEWDKDESWSRLIVHCKKEGAPQPKKKSKKVGMEGDAL